MITEAPRQQDSFAQAGYAGTIARAFPADVVAGNSLVVVAVMSDNPPAPTCTDTLGNTYVLRSVQGNGGTGLTTMIFDAIGIVVGGPNTVTVASNAGSVTSRNIRIYEWEGVVSFVGTNTAFQIAGTTVITTGTVAPGGNGRLFFAAAEGQATIAVDAPFTARQAPTTETADASYLQAVAATIEATWTDGAGAARGILVVYAPAASTAALEEDSGCCLPVRSDSD